MPIFNSVRLAEWAMRLMERVPSESDLAMAQFFNTDQFRNATSEDRIAMLRASSRFRDDYERVLPFERHFRVSLNPYIRGKVMLDLGCFTGGRTVSWHRRYGASKSIGIDIDPLFIEAADQYSTEQGIDAEFVLGFGESLPFESSSIDVVMSFDVLEHVKDVGKTMEECCRVLKPNGSLIAVFPPFFCPTEHHLSGVTRTPAIHWIFNPDTLYRAYRKIIMERPSSSWYLPAEESLSDWEKLYTLNGITVSGFLQIVERQGWIVDHMRLPMWPSTTRYFFSRPVLSRIWDWLGVATKVPGVCEFITDRICVILTKRPESSTG